MFFNSFNSLGGKINFKAHYILFFLIIATIVVVAINPRYIFKNGQMLNSEFNNLKPFHNTCYLGNSNWIGFEERSRHINIYLYNEKSKQFSQTELAGYTASSLFGDTSFYYYYNESAKTCYTTLKKKFADYYLLTIKYDSSLTINSEKMFRYELADEIMKDSINVNGCIFYYTDNNDVDTFTIQKENLNEYRILMSSNYYLSYRQELAYNLGNEICNELVSKITEVTGKSFTKENIYEIIMFFARRSYIQNKLDYDSSLVGFYNVQTILPIDSNQDGNEDLLIKFKGDRFVNAQLICYDKTNHQILWRRQFAPKLLNLTVQDINNDGLEEIMFSSYAAASEMPIDYYKHPETFSTDRSYFKVLNSDGSDFIINALPVEYQAPSGFNEIQYTYLKELNSFLLGINSVINNKNFYELKLLNLTKNRIEGLKYNIKNVLFMQKVNNKIMIFEFTDDTLSKYVFDLHFNLLSTKKIKLPKSSLHYLGSGKIFNRDYHVFDPLMLVSNDLETILDYSSKKTKHLYFIDNSIYLINHNLFSDGNFNKITFTKNRSLNPYLLIIFLLEFFVLIFCYFIEQIIATPISSPQRSYFIYYNFLNLIQKINLKGKISKNIQLPRRYLFSKSDILETLSELSETPKLIYKKNFLLFKYLVYEIQSRDESEIIQRISHDMKNQILMMKMLTDQHTEEIKAENNNYLKRMTCSIDTISDAVQTLSRFSHIDKLYKDKIEFNMFIRNVLMHYLEHQYYHAIEFKPAKTDIEISIDENLIRIALDNLIMNALEEIEEDQKIKIKIEKTKSEIVLTISNPINRENYKLEEFGNVGYSSKTKGSGIGLPIAKVIIERHDGELKYFVENREFIVEIKLPVM